MPHINRVRVNNVKYNFGTQFYDDFLMRFSGKNTIYDLANGGGKSVLMLLLLQNLIPNCTLDEKQPIEKLFRTSGGSTTIHSLIEWKLSDIHIKENYKYMLTGFCARKAKDAAEVEENRDISSIEYFNYVIFYREFNDNDIKNLPLSNGKERITYMGLKNYLRELSKTDLSLKIEIFERKGEYQRYISQFGLYESEWEIIRGINKTEGHVRTYFETNYKTTRKVVEDLLIEEIIEKSFRNRTFTDDEGEAMARTLIDIKDKLLELSKRKEDIVNFDRQIEVIDEFSKRVQSVKELYYGRDDLADEIIRCYYSIKKAMENEANRKEDIDAQIKSSMVIYDNYQREIETAKQKKEIAKKEELEEQLANMQQEAGALGAEYEKLSEKLTISESVNDYADYVFYKKERDELRTLVDNIMRDKGEVIAELHLLASEKAKRNEAVRNELLSEIEKEEKIINMEKTLTESLREEDENYKKKQAISEYLVLEIEKQKEELSNELTEIRNNFDGIVSFDLKKQKASVLMEYEKLCEKLEHLKEELTFKNTEQEQLIYKLEEIHAAARKLDEDILINIDKREELRAVLKKLEKLVMVYGQKDAAKLYEEINRKYVETGDTLVELKSNKKMKSAYEAALNEGCPVINNEDIKKVYEYIIRYHGEVAVLGSSFIAALSLEQRKAALEKNPLLPYSIIVKSDFHTIMADTKLKEINAMGNAVPVIRFEAVKNGEYTVDSNNLSFIMCNEELFFEQETIEKQKLKVKEELTSIEFKITQLEETMDLLKIDMEFIKKYVDEYERTIENCEKEYEEQKSYKKALEKETEQLEEKQLENKDNCAKLLEQIEDCTIKCQKSKEQTEVIEKLYELSVKQNELIQKEEALNQEVRDSKKKYEALKARLQAEEIQLQGRREHINFLSEKLKKITQNWDTNYKLYYDENTKGESGLNDEELEVRFMGLKRSVESNSLDISDKRKLIENYDIAMEKSLQAIDYNGMFAKDVKKLYETGEVKNCTKEELKKLKALIDTAKKKAEDKLKEIALCKTNKDKMEGSIEHGRAAIVEKYGIYQDIEIPLNDYDGFILEKSNEIAKHDQKISALKKEIDVLTKREQRLIILQRDIEKTIQAARLNTGNEEKLLPEGINIEEKTGNVVEKYDKFLKEMYDKKDEFEKEKQMLADILFKLGANQLSLEIGQNALMPEGVAEAEQLINALNDITRCIALEKDRIGKSIEDMVKIKENFENQCIQTCVNIKTELDRLPKLSKIFMDNETISIISLNIPYVKEEQYKMNMENYIDEIVDTADTLKTDAEKIKYIKNQLSFKKLFSVIVNDMNAIKLNLYKRERIKEQSRYLKYEEAVGSTGQSQGIYIQFLIAIINYITSINSKSSEGSGLKKVIFIDNPFGAAKDIYIWEPIFKLLKTNNVQLIVPCRGATPAITGRFDVNYILGQKLIDGKQQTVVVDYCSNVDNEQMDYATLTYEQTALF